MVYNEINIYIYVHTHMYIYDKWCVEKKIRLKSILLYSYILFVNFFFGFQFSFKFLLDTR